MSCVSIDKIQFFKALKQKFIYIGKARLSLNPDKWNILYTNNDLIKTNKNNRIYIIVVNDIIKKIGSSCAKGGIKDTFRHYINPGNSASIRTTGINRLILLELKQKNNVEFYCRYNKSKKEIIQGLTSDIEIDVCSNILYTEKLCLRDYYHHFKQFPDWNYKENNKKWNLKE